MSERLERVAQAIADSGNVSADGAFRTDVYLTTQPWHRNAARAAIAAMTPDPDLESARQAVIAAAPDLLEALKSSLDFLTDKRIGTINYMEGSEFYEDCDRITAVVRKAIAKATEGT